MKASHLLVIVLFLSVSAVGAFRLFKAKTSEAVIREQQSAKALADCRLFGKKLLPLLEKWKASRPAAPPQLRGDDVQLVIDPDAGTIRLEQGGTAVETFALPDGYDWKMYRITPERIRQLHAAAHLVFRGRECRQNVCREVFVLSGALSPDEGLHIDIRPSGTIGMGIGNTRIATYKTFPAAGDDRPADTINESMFVGETAGDVTRGDEGEI